MKANPPEPLRYEQVSEAARTLLDTEGESNRFEFKRTPQAVSTKVLTAAANWVALQPGETEVTLLVGVDEKKDASTGLVVGDIVGVKDLQKAAEAVQNACRETKPVPVDVTIIEEGVRTSTPFLRLKIRPTHPPHYDGEGRRVTRNNASTRPLMDEELLSIYLGREAEQFQQRFRRIADDVLATLGEVAAGVAELSDELGGASSAAWTAVDEAQNSASVAERIERTLDNMFDFVEEIHDKSPYQIYFDLRQKRDDVWQMFVTDALARSTKTTEKVLERLRKQLQLPIEGNDWEVNLGETQFWDSVLERRGSRGTMTSWSRELAALEMSRETTDAPLEDDLVQELLGQLSRDS